MSIDQSTSQTHQKIANTLIWLRKHVSSNAELHADTRSIISGDVFVTYPVHDSDSRIFIQDAVIRGAAGILYQPDGFSIAPGILPMLEVSKLNTIAGDIASAWYGYPSNKMLVIGVTGTNGKTSCTQWIAAALTALSCPCAVIGTLGIGMLGKLSKTNFTMPDALQLQRNLARLYYKEGAQAVAIEVSSHGLHQGRANGTLFDIAVFTNLSQDHLDYHRTLDAYEEAKLRLFASPNLNSAVINLDDPVGIRLLKKLTGRLRTISYGIENTTKSSADFTIIADNVHLTDTGSTFRICSPLGSAHLKSTMLGRFNISNLLAVLCTLLAAEVPFSAALTEILRLGQISGRMQKIGGRLEKDEPLIVIDYAHTPDALEKALITLRLIAASRGGALICMFGCGGERDEKKRALMGSIAERLSDHVIVTNDNPRSEDPQKIINHIISDMNKPNKAYQIKDRASAIWQTILSVSGVDVVLVAGKGHEITQEIMGEKYAFSDQDQVRQALVAREMYIEKK
ncbi:MAG: UDP-N-acetylmuramoyl-L-alanyl-D-glutamate--2,6-diaminopimelate ligase [Burkholderia sp.]|nr:UDP-N-acetylmuramoyl-L-alanyl-D-glutamate--2,6-diaminopimelate ligase [Burkholderia sp.]